MDRKHIIADMRHNLQKVTQIISLIENYENSNAGVELDLLQKNITVLFESYVRLKMNYEHRDSVAASSNIKEEPKIITIKESAKEIEMKEERPAKTGYGFNFNLGDDEGKINHKIETVPEEKPKLQSDFNLEKAINEALNIALNQTAVKPVDTPIKEVEKVETDKDQSVNARFSSLKKDVNLADKHRNNPIADLSKEISLNKKFAFVNELFGGSMENYNAKCQYPNDI